MRARWSCVSVSVLSLALAAGADARQPDFDSVQIESQRVGEGVYMLVGQGGNIGVSVGEDGVFLIDDQYAPLTEKIRAAVAELSSQPVRFVLNTHWHGDHTGGNENLGEAGALIVAHENVRQRMSTEQFIALFDSRTPPSPEAALPVVTFNDRVTFHLNGDEIRAWHVAPAHTDGDSVVHFRRANVIHAGDLYFNGIYPFIDTGSGGSIDGMIAGARRLLQAADDDTRIIPGHGPVSSRAELAAYRDMLKGVRDAVEALVAEGMSADEVVAAKPTAPWDEKWGQGFMEPEVFTRIVYESLTSR